MRLGQLARKAEKKPVELIQILQEQGINDYTHANSKMSEEHEEWVISYLGLKTEVEQEEISIEINKDIESSLESEQTPIKNDLSVTDLPLETENDKTSEIKVEKLADEELNGNENGGEEIESSTEEEIEVIKAPKIELPGLKVVGKIDLPEPKKKEVVSMESENSADKTASKKQPRRHDKNRKSNRRKNPDYNPVAAQRERQRKYDEREALKKHEQLKKKKKQHYQEKVADQKAAPSKKKKNVKPASYTQVVAETSQTSNKAKKPNAIVRLWRWLNTY
jgi:hypothetical protein